MEDLPREESFEKLEMDLDSAEVNCKINRSAFLGSLVKAENDLAYAKMKRDIRDEEAKMESFVEEELERIRLEKEKGNIPESDQQCAVCHLDFGNLLQNAKDHGHQIWASVPLYCCGRRLCRGCLIAEANRTMGPVDTKMEKYGGIFFLESTLVNCPNCKKKICKTDAQKLKSIQHYAAEGVSWAMGDLALALSTGKYGARAKPNRALKWLAKAAEKGHSQSICNLGVCYYGGGDQSPLPFGHVDKSVSEAKKWFKAAANYGVGGAYYYLAMIRREAGETPRKRGKKSKGPAYDETEYYRYLLLSAYMQQSDGSDLMDLAAYHFKKSNFDDRILQDFEGPDDLINEGKTINENELIHFNLCIYWAGKCAAKYKSESARLFLSKWLPFAGHFWQPRTFEVQYPGFSTLPLAKWLSMKNKHPVIAMSDLDTVTLDQWKTRCMGCGTRASNLLACSRCKVFHYCNKECQLTHYHNGHKRDCKKHWVEDFFPELRLD